MKKFLFLLFLLVSPTVNAAETLKDYVTGLPSANTLGGTEFGYSVQGGVSKKFTMDQIKTFVGTSSGGGDGVINVRTLFGAVPDGSTDNSSVIAAAFAASNAVVSGVPTVYFDCDVTKTTCVYNYGGSGASPINPTRPTSIVCAPGTTLNYTGTAHAVDIGTISNTTFQIERYLIQGCRWTGGANYTAGIYVQDRIITTSIVNNTFVNFGTSTGWTIVYPHDNWFPIVAFNTWSDTDGKTRNMVDAHGLQNGYLLFTGNVTLCGETSCSVSNARAGIWTRSAIISNNDIESHNPVVILSSCATCGTGVGVNITGNHFEHNTGVLTPAITVGDPNTAGVAGPVTRVSGNSFFWPSTDSGISVVGPSVASSGSHFLSNSTFADNWFQSTPVGAPYINSNGGTSNVMGINFDSSRQILTQSSTPTLMDTGFGAAHAYWISYTLGPP